MVFRPGKSGNPSGKPKGTRNKTTLAIEHLLDGEAQAITRKAIEILILEPSATELYVNRICTSLPRSLRIA